MKTVGSRTKHGQYEYVVTSITNTETFRVIEPDGDGEPWDLHSTAYGRAELVFVWRRALPERGAVPATNPQVGFGVESSLRAMDQTMWRIARLELLLNDANAVIADQADEISRLQKQHDDVLLRAKTLCGDIRGEQQRARMLDSLRKLERMLTEAAKGEG